MPNKTLKQPARAQTRKRPKPEIVAKLGYSLREHRDGRLTTLPLLTLLCDREGYMVLSRVFARRARDYDRSMRRTTQDDHDHEHLFTEEDDFNGKLSDLIELRLVTLFPSKRRVTLGYYGATAAGAKKSAATETLVGIAKRARKDQRETRASFAEIDARMEAESTRRKPPHRDGTKKPAGNIAVAGKSASKRKGRRVAAGDGEQIVGASGRPIRIRSDRRKK